MLEDPPVRTWRCLCGKVVEETGRWIKPICESCKKEVNRAVTFAEIVAVRSDCAIGMKAASKRGSVNHLFVPLESELLPGYLKQLCRKKLSMLEHVAKPTDLVHKPELPDCLICEDLARRNLHGDVRSARKQAILDRAAGEREEDRG